jgi:hypothetical protein
VRAVLLLYSLSAVQQTCAAIAAQPAHCDTAHQFGNTIAYISDQDAEVLAQTELRFVSADLRRVEE